MSHLPLRLSRTSHYVARSTTISNTTCTRITSSTPLLPRSYYHSHGLFWTKQNRTQSLNSSSKSSPSLISRHVRSIFIQTEPTPNADALKFIPGRPVMTNGTREFLAGDDTRSSPLARSLLAVEGVKSVFFGPDFISINKNSETGWPTMKPEIYSIMMEFFSASDQAVVQEGPIEEQTPMDTRVNENDTEVVAMIKELLETRVRPAIQEDGGDLEYKGFNEETGVVQLMLKGSCRGCDSSAVTLKSGIERMLMHYVPEVQAVEQVLSEEEKMAEDEFAKFEARLRGGGKTVGI